MNLIGKEKKMNRNFQKKKLAQLDEREKKFIGIDGQPMYFTRKNVTDLYGDGEAQKIDVFEQLQESLSDNQVKY